MRIRVTTQMLSHNRKRSGLPSGGGSLLDYVRQNRTGGSSRLSSMNASTSGVRGNRLLGSSYEKLDTSAGELADRAKVLGAGVDGEDKNIADQAEKMANSFNETLSELKGASGVLNQYYYQTMKETSTGNQNALAEIGITVAADGRLSVNREKLENADAEKVKKLLGSQGDFLKKVSFVATLVSENARASAASLSNTYNSRGDLSNSYLSRISYRR